MGRLVNLGLDVVFDVGVLRVAFHPQIPVKQGAPGLVGVLSQFGKCEPQ